MNSLYTHSLKNEDLFKHITSMVASGALNEKVRIRCVCVKQIVESEEKWVNATLAVRLFGKSEKLSNVDNRKYGDAEFLEEWISLDRVVEWLDQASKNLKISICRKEVVFLDKSIAFNNREFFPSKNDKFEFSSYCYFSNPSNQVNMMALNRPLFDFDEPLFETGADALQDWFEEKRLTSVSDGCRGLVFVFMPENRAYFGNVRNNGDEIELNIVTNFVSEKELRLKGNWRKGSELISFNEDVKNNTCSFVIPDKAEELFLYLIDKSNEVYDYHKEYKVHYEGQTRWLVSEKKEDSNDELINKVRLSGEGETVEFKARLEEKEGDFLERVRKTVVAFANGKGGTLFLGIDDECQIVGVEQQFIKYLSDDDKLKEALSKYEGWLRQAINDGLYKTLSKPIGFSYAWKNGHLILIVTVFEGENKPYSYTNKVPYVRHGPNTVIADPETEVPLLRKVSNDQPGGMATPYQDE